LNNNLQCSWIQGVKLELLYSAFAPLTIGMITMTL
jgi:hypothetical protein